MNDSYVTDYQPPTSTDQDSATANPVDDANTDTNTHTKTDIKQALDDRQSQLLEDQNIFTLLGVADGSEEEKSQFLDDLQQVIWEDFLENDVALLILDSEYQKLQEITGGTSRDLSVETQEKIVEYLEKLIPDLEEIMVDKAVRLKADLFRERIASLKSLHSDDIEKMQTIVQAESLMHQGSWTTAAETLDQL